MNSDIDLTENSDFRDGINPGSYYLKKYLFRNWTDNCLPKPDKTLREAGVRVFSQPSEFPPSDRCECCGGLKPPWEKDLCKRCGMEIVTPDDISGLPRNPEMVSNSRDLII